MDNKLLRKAKKNKMDEFYTQLVDIERELANYTSYFQNKIVYCNCDDPLVSNFYRYFVENFSDLGLKKVIASSYVDNEANLFNFNNKYRGYYYEYSGKEGEKKYPDYSDLVYFEGNGDFRSEESLSILKNSDVVVTNPPFSLFREYVNQLIEYNKDFLIIGNINAITYKDIFNLIKDDKAWLGINYGRGISGFIVPEHYHLYGTETKIDEEGNRIVSTNNCLWLTNIDNYKRHTAMKLTKSYYENPQLYEKYDNYNGININKTINIPYDYEGAMGVPITFLTKFNPDQFEIIKFRKGDDEKDLSINGKTPYFRILIRNKNVIKRLE